MWHTCAEGVLLGLGLAVMLGPAFFSLVQTSLRNGFTPYRTFTTKKVITIRRIIMSKHIHACDKMDSQVVFVLFKKLLTILKK